VQPRRGTVAVANGEIDVLAREIDVLRRGAYAQVDLRMRFGEATQAMDQPLGCEVRRGGDGERATALTLQQTFGAAGNAIERVAHDGEVGAARLGDDEPLPLAVEQLYAQLALKRLHLMAHRALSDAELFSGAGETLVARRCLEGFQGVERRQSARHGRYDEKN